MLALDFSNPTAEIEAKLQSYVAKFLAGRERLVKASRSSDIDVQNRARTLLVKQTSLETRLPVMLKVVEDVKKGVWTVGGLAGVGAFVNEMISQVKETDKISGSVAPTQASFGALTTSPIALAIFGIGAQFGIRMLEKAWSGRKRR